MLDNIQITTAAATQIDKLRKTTQENYVRLSIQSGGCNGFSKVWSFDSKFNEDDSQFSCCDSVLLIDRTSLEILKDCVIDYKTDLMGSYFTVEIPAAVSSCGCGTSFSL